MSKAKHSPGLLAKHAKNGRLIVSGETKIATAERCVANPPQAWANADRLIDCWNACEGIADPSAVKDMLHELREILAYAREENAPLREQELQSIQRVIAKATGES